jgi:hypothetical protein
MDEMILSGQGHQIVKIPRTRWEAHLTHIPQHGRERLGFMTADHQRVRNFVVTELARLGKPLEAETISYNLNLPIQRVIAILAELEKHLTFLVRNQAGAVVWAFPVTVEPTPHELSFKSGERLYGA